MTKIKKALKKNKTSKIGKTNDKNKLAGSRAKAGSGRLGKKKSTPKNKKTKSPSRKQTKTVPKNSPQKIPIKPKDSTTLKGKRFLSKEIEQDVLLEKARKNLTSKLNSIDSKKRKLYKDERERAHLVKALLGKNDRNIPATTLNIINPSDDTSNHSVKSNIEKEIIFIDSDSRDSISSVNAGDNDDKSSTKSGGARGLSENDEMISFNTPLRSNNRYSSEVNPFFTEIQSEGSNFQTPEAQKSVQKSIKRSGNLTRQYLSKLSNKNDRDLLDTGSTGIKIKNGCFYIGNSEVKFENNDLIIGNNQYKATQGLLELMFYKQPDKKRIEKLDLENYKIILEQSSAHLKYYSTEFPIAASKSVKYKNIIAPLFARPIKEVHGTGATTAFHHYSNPNEIIERYKVNIFYYCLHNFYVY